MYLEAVHGAELYLEAVQGAMYLEAVQGAELYLEAVH